MLRFRRVRSLQKFASVLATVSNHFNHERSLSSRHLFKVTTAVLLALLAGVAIKLKVFGDGP